MEVRHAARHRVFGTGSSPRTGSWPLKASTPSAGLGRTIGSSNATRCHYVDLPIPATAGSIPLFPRIYAPSALCSLSPIFPEPYVPSALHSLKPMFFQPHVPSALCSINPISPQPYVPSALYSLSPTFPQPYVPSALCSLSPMFPQHVQMDLTFTFCQTQSWGNDKC